MFGITSCKKETSEQSSNSIVGTWKVRSYVITAYPNRPDPMNFRDIVKNQNPKPTVEFKENGLFIHTIAESSTINSEFSYAIRDNQITFGRFIAFGAKIFTYEKDGNVLTLKYNSGTPGSDDYYTQTIILDKI